MPASKDEDLSMDVIDEYKMNNFRSKLRGVGCPEIVVKLAPAKHFKALKGLSK